MSDLNRSLEKLLSAAVDRKVAPGLVAVVTNRNGESAQAAFGLASNDGPTTPLGLDTSIWLASMSKSVVSLAALILVEKHNFNLDSHGELIKILPELTLGNGRPVSKIFDGKNDDGTIKLREAKVGITLRHLLTHTSGLAYEWSTANNAAWVAEGNATLASGSSTAYDTPREFEAGTGWTYGAGADWVGRWVERVNKSTLRQTMQDLVLTPLGVPADSLDSFVTPKMKKDRSAMHFKAAPGTFIVIPFETPQFEKKVPEGMATMASAPLHGNLLGFSKVLQCLLNEGRPLLSPATWNDASSDALVRYGLSLPTPLLTTADPNTSNSVDRFIKPQDASSTLGEGWTTLQTVFVREKSTTGLTKGSLTWAGLANSNYFVCPDLGIAGSIAAQFLPWADPEMNEVIEQFQSWTIENFAKR